MDVLYVEEGGMGGGGTHPLTFPLQAVVEVPEIVAHFMSCDFLWQDKNSESELKRDFLKVGWNQIWRHLWLHCHCQGTVTLHFQSSSTARLFAWIKLPIFICTVSSTNVLKRQCQLYSCLVTYESSANHWINWSVQKFHSPVSILPTSFLPPNTKRRDSVGIGIFTGM